VVVNQAVLVDSTQAVTDSFPSLVVLIGH
jgi:hypothetical protein